jgi:hypothetical protein
MNQKPKSNSAIHQALILFGVITAGVVCICAAGMLLETVGAHREVPHVSTPAEVLERNFKSQVQSPYSLDITIVKKRENEFVSVYSIKDSQGKVVIDNGTMAIIYDGRNAIITGMQPGERINGYMKVAEAMRRAQLAEAEKQRQHDAEFQAELEKAKQPPPTSSRRRR